MGTFPGGPGMSLRFGQGRPPPAQHVVSGGDGITFCPNMLPRRSNAGMKSPRLTDPKYMDTSRFELRVCGKRKHETLYLARGLHGEHGLT
jgi:hypothetical protein